MYMKLKLEQVVEVNLGDCDTYTIPTTFTKDEMKKLASEYEVSATNCVNATSFTSESLNEYMYRRMSSASFADLFDFAHSYSYSELKWLMEQHPVKAKITNFNPYL